MRPIRLPLVSVNQRLPSGPAVIPKGPLLTVGIENSVIVPVGVMRPILLLDSVNQRLPSGLAVIDAGSLLAVETGNSVTAPAPMAPEGAENAKSSRKLPSSRRSGLRSSRFRLAQYISRPPSTVEPTLPVRFGSVLCLGIVCTQGKFKVVDKDATTEEEPAAE